MSSNTEPSDWLTTISSSNKRAGLCLTIIALMSFLPAFFSLPAIDRDEARYAQATRQMVASGDWIDIRLQDQPRYKQPIGIYWLQSVAVSSLGTDGRAPIWAHRLPSLLGATIAVLLTYWIALPLIGARAAFLAGAVMAASIILGVEARLAKTDATLLAATLLAQGVLVRAYLTFKNADTNYFEARKRWLYPALFWTAMAIGTLVKGPLIIAFVGLTIASLAVVERSTTFLRILRPGIGILWFLALTLPWYIAIGFWTDGAFYKKAVGFSIMGKITQGHEGHGAPPLTHFAVFWAIFWPGSLLFALVIKDIWRQRKETWLRFLICWVIPAWIVFELVATKLPHYLLPVFPAIAIATMGILINRQHIVTSAIGARIIQILMAVLGVTAIVVIAGAAWFADDQIVSIRLVILSLLAVISVVAAFRYNLSALRDNDVTRFSAGLIISTIAFYWLLYPSLARIQQLWPGPQITEIIETQKQCDRPHLVSAGYGEASLVFNTRTDIVFTDGQNAAGNLQDTECAIALVERQHLAAFRNQTLNLNIQLKQIGHVSGFNIANSRPLDVTIFATLKTPSE